MIIPPPPANFVQRAIARPIKKVSKSNYIAHEDARIVKKYSDGGYDALVDGRDFPYHKGYPTDREAHYRVGDIVRIGIVRSDTRHNTIWFIIGLKAGTARGPKVGGGNTSGGNGPFTRFRPPKGGKKLKNLPGWLTWGCYHPQARYFVVVLESEFKYLNENPTPIYNLKGSGMLRTFEEHGVAIGRETSGTGEDQVTRYVIVKFDDDGALVIFRFDQSWEPAVGAGPYGGFGPTPSHFMLSDDANLAITLWGSTNGGSWSSTAPEPNIGGPECRDEE